MLPWGYNLYKILWLSHTNESENLDRYYIVGVMKIDSKVCFSVRHMQTVSFIVLMGIRLKSISSELYGNVSRMYFGGFLPILRAIIYGKYSSGVKWYLYLLRCSRFPQGHCKLSHLAIAVDNNVKGWRLSQDIGGACGSFYSGSIPKI